MKFDRRRNALMIAVALCLSIGISSCGPKDKGKPIGIDSGGGVCTPISLAPTDGANEGQSVPPPPVRLVSPTGTPVKTRSHKSVIVAKPVANEYRFALTVACEDNRGCFSVPKPTVTSDGQTPIGEDRVTVSLLPKHSVNTIIVGGSIEDGIAQTATLLGTIKRTVVNEVPTYKGPIKLSFDLTVNGELRQLNRKIDITANGQS